MFRLAAVQILTGLAFLLSASSSCYAIPVLSTPKMNFVPVSSEMDVFGISRAPRAHSDFCARNPDECQKVESESSTKDGAMILNTSRWKELVRINAKYNRNIRGVPDKALHGRAELWSLPARYGDCEDYAIAKRNALIKAGWSSSSVLLTTAYNTRGRGHAVLIARTDRGDFVLDNLIRDVRAWEKVRYRWLKRQSTEDPKDWVWLDYGHTLLLAAQKRRIKKLRLVQARKRKILAAQSRLGKLIPLPARRPANIMSSRADTEKKIQEARARGKAQLISQKAMQQKSLQAWRRMQQALLS